jgi:hypothetical protein
VGNRWRRLLCHPSPHPWVAGAASGTPSLSRRPAFWRRLGLKGVCEQEMLDDDLGFSDVTVEAATKIR